MQQHLQTPFLYVSWAKDAQCAAALVGLYVLCCAVAAGADLLGQGAAALAAVSTVFKDRDEEYSAKLLEVARGLYNQVRPSAESAVSRPAAAPATVPVCSSRPSSP